MASARVELERLFDANGGLLATPADPALARSLHRMAAAGSVRRIVPGVFCREDLADDPVIRIRAVGAWLPDAVVTGDAAARWTFWPERTVGRVTAAHRRARAAPAGFELTRATVPVELRRRANGVHLTCPALTALDLAVGRLGGGDRPGPADQGLHPGRHARGLTADAGPYGQRCPPRAAARQSRRAVVGGRTPRARLLRAHGIRRWQANVEVRCGSRLYYVDLAFAAVRLAIEIDGFAVHSRPEQFHRDRQKWTDLAVAGWHVLHFTWSQLLHEQEWVIDTVRTTLARLTSLAG